MERPTKTLVLSMFKTGSCTIGGTLDVNGVEVVRTHDFNEVSAAHPAMSFRYIITAVRDPYRQFISAFFEDMCSPSYPYYFGDRARVESADVDLLIDHFLKYPWHTYDHLNFEIYRQQIIDNFDVDIYDYPFDVATGMHMYANSRGQIIIVMTAERINQNMPELMRRLYRVDNFIPEKINQCNLAAQKWYDDVYRKFIERLEARGGRRLLTLPSRARFYRNETQPPA